MRCLKRLNSLAVSTRYSQLTPRQRWRSTCAKTGALGQALGASRLFQALAMATPGMRELLGVGKVYELAQFTRHTEDADPYDMVIVDSPATGADGILRAPGTFASARGPTCPGTAQRISADGRRGLHSGRRRVHRRGNGSERDTVAARSVAFRRPGAILVFINGLLPERFTAEARRLRKAHGKGADGALAAALSDTCALLASANSAPARRAAKRHAQSVAYLSARACWSPSYAP